MTSSGITNLFNCGKRLNLKSSLICSASIYYHKFYRNLNRTSNEAIDENLVAVTCLYLASKTEESPLKSKDLLSEFSDCVGGADINLAKFTNLKESIIYLELLLCQLIDFELNNNLPHKYLLHYLKTLNEWIIDDPKDAASFSNLCWLLLSMYIGIR